MHQAAVTRQRRQRKWAGAHGLGCVTHSHHRIESVVRASRWHLAPQTQCLGTTEACIWAQREKQLDSLMTSAMAVGVESYGLETLHFLLLGQ